MPGVQYSLRLVADAGKKRAIDSKHAVALTTDSPFQLTFQYAVLAKEWVAGGFEFENVTVTLLSTSPGGDAVVVPYAGIANAKGGFGFAMFDAGESVSSDKKITVAMQQVAYGENIKAFKTAKAGENIAWTKGTPLSTAGKLLVEVKITPLTDDAELIITASVTGTERSDDSNQWVATISEKGGRDALCSGVEELYGDVRSLMQSMFIRCHISKTRGHTIKAGKELTFWLRAGTEQGEFCNNCADDGYGKGGGSIASTMLIQEISSPAEVTCKNAPSKPIHHLVQSKVATGKASGVSDRTISFGQFPTFCREKNCNRAPDHNSGHELHELKITPTHKDSWLLIEGTGQGTSACNGGHVQLNICIYSSSAGGKRKTEVCVTDEIDAWHCTSYQQVSTLTAQRMIQAGTTDEITFSLRIGTSAGSTFYGSKVNGNRNNPTPILGGNALRSTFKIQEISTYTFTAEAFTNDDEVVLHPLIVRNVFNGFSSYKKLGGSIPWSSTEPTKSRGSQLAASEFTMTDKTSMIEVRCQAWMVEYDNTADHSTICLFSDGKLLNCGTEEDTRGQQWAHPCQTTWLFYPGTTDTLKFQCRGGVNGGTAAYNGGHSGAAGAKLGNTLWTEMSISEIPNPKA